MFDFLAFVKAQAAVDFVGDAAAEQALFDDAGLGIAAVEDGDFVQIPAFAFEGFGFVNDEPGFFEVGKGGVVADFVACFGVGAQVFAEAFVVVFDNGVGGSKDIADGAVVLFKFDGRVDVELFHQCGHIADVRASEPVNALVVVADGKYRRVAARHQFQPRVLQFVGILELVNENVVEAVLVVPAQYFIVLQHFVAAEHKLGEINHAFALADFVVFGVTLNYAARMRIGRTQHGSAQTGFFLRVDKALQRTRRDDFFGDVEAFEQAFDEGKLVAAVEDLKGRRQTGIAVVSS
ncbi:hypothetical protein NEIFLAOT_02510 [Neisseria flavescens NRL30031/H210]|uniref:Uncharacterized protein n=1 Tax=Neisseria flavescens NRL30031/H210 TaxID=546264 RepID=C0ERA9_NEIFL|nr:hypothetical protein NEIFLAOT_02510 [Neisseria flavescens NRL30031/H210]